jgi:hypothetical protein
MLTNGSHPPRQAAGSKGKTEAFIKARRAPVGLVARRGALAM